MLQALFGDLDEGVKLAAQVKARKDILTTAGGDTAMQLAQLVALEYLVGVAMPARIKEVHISGFFLTEKCPLDSPVFGMSWFNSRVVMRMILTWVRLLSP